MRGGVEKATGAVTSLGEFVVLCASLGCAAAWRDVAKEARYGER